jgi:hypothetical protein
MRSATRPFGVVETQQGICKANNGASTLAALALNRVLQAMQNTAIATSRS